MKMWFLQTAKHSTNNTISSGSFEGLCDRIYKRTGLKYAYRQQNAGYRLIPTFRNMQRRNSFAPEIDIAISGEEMHTMLRISGKPVRSVRIFMAAFLGALLMVELLLLILAACSKLDSLLLLLVPFAIGVFSYVLCRCVTKATFMSVIKAIQEEFS